MTYRKQVLCLLAAGVIATPAVAGSEREGSFTALQNVEAQALSAAEMQAIAGQLNAYDIAASLFALATRLSRYPRLAESVTRLAEWYLANAEAINAKFMLWGIYTPPR